MKTVLVLGLTLLLGQAFGQSKDESAVLALSKQKFDWLLAGDTDALSRLMDDRGVLSHLNGRVQSKNDYLDDLKSKRLTYKTIEAKDATVRIIGQTAIVLGTSVFTITAMGNNPPPFNLAYEEVYTKEGNQWKLVMYSVKRTGQ